MQRDALLPHTARLLGRQHLMHLIPARAKSWLWWTAQLRTAAQGQGRSLCPSPPQGSQLPLALPFLPSSIQALLFLSYGSKTSLANVFLNAKLRTCYCWTRGRVKKQQHRRKTVPEYFTTALTA